MSIQSITIPAGSPYYIPSNATIISITTTDGAIATSDCIDIPNTPTKCYAFLWQTNAEDYEDAIFDKIIVGVLEWPIPENNSLDDGTPNQGLAVGNALNSVVNKIWTATYYFEDGDDKGVMISIPDIGYVPQLRVNQGVGSVTTYLHLQGILSECTAPEGWTSI